MNRLVDCDFFRNIDNLLKYDEVIIYGVGSHFYEVYEFVRELDIPILAICDKNPDKQGEEICSIRIVQPKCAIELYRKNHTAVVVGVVTYQREIFYYLTQEFNVATEDVFSFLTSFAAEYMYDSAAIIKNSQAVSDAYSLLSDNQSKELYYNILNAKLTMSPLYLIQNPLMSAPYEYSVTTKETIPPAANDVIIDCGAYVGDTAEFFLKRYPGLSKVVCIEPLKKNYERIVTWMNKNNLTERILPIHAALGEKVGITEIQADEEISVSASTDLTDEKKKISETIKLETLDSLFSEYKKIDFIKFDIEGMEMDALRGGLKTIGRLAPYMMVSAYHRTRHLWEIPLFIHEHFPESRIYLGHQLNAPFEPEYYIVIGG